MKKLVFIDPRAYREIKKFPKEVQKEIFKLVGVLEQKGTLEVPDGKKLVGCKNLYELRVRHLGQWRSIYAYCLENRIILLTAFQKKTQKTPENQINRAITRLKLYSES